MIELGKIHFFINTQRGTEHFLTFQEDEELVELFVEDLKHFLEEHAKDYIVVGSVSYKRGCLEIIVQFNINISATDTASIQNAISFLANIGGVLGLIDLLTGNYIGKTIKFGIMKLHSTISKKEIRDQNKLESEAKEILNKNGFGREEIEKLIGHKKHKPKGTRL